MQREKEFRKSLERRLEEARTAAQSDIARLEKDLLEMRDREIKKHAEVMALKEERDAVREKVNSLKLDLTNSNAVESSLQQEILQLRRELSQQRNRVVEAEALVDRLANETKSAREELLEKARATERAISDREAMYAELMETKNRLENECLETKKALESDFVHKAGDLQADVDLVRLEMEIKVASISADLEASKNALAEKKRELEDERRENAALRLRLQLHESAGFPDGQGRGPAGAGNRLQRPAHPNRLSVDSSDQDVGIAVSSSGRFGGRRQLDIGIEPSSAVPVGLPSPIFSDDFGPMSIPASPAPLHYPNRGSGFSSGGPYHPSTEANLLYSQYQQHHNHQRPSVDSDNQQLDVGFDPHSNSSDPATMEENERLKRIIKEVHNDKIANNRVYIVNLNARIWCRCGRIWKACRRKWSILAEAALTTAGWRHWRLAYLTTSLLFSIMS